MQLFYSLRYNYYGILFSIIFLLIFVLATFVSRSNYDSSGIAIIKNLVLLVCSKKFILFYAMAFQCCSSKSRIQRTSTLRICHSTSMNWNWKWCCLRLDESFRHASSETFLKEVEELDSREWNLNNSAKRSSRPITENSLRVCYLEIVKQWSIAN